MATTAFVLLVLATLVALGRPSAPLTARALPGAALRGVVVLSRLSDRRRERTRSRVSADHGLVAHRARSRQRSARATTP